MVQTSISPQDTLVQNNDNPEALVQLVSDDDVSVRRAAAEKLVKMWKDGHVGMTRKHLCYVADHGEEPYRSDANTLYYAEKQQST